MKRRKKVRDWSEYKIRAESLTELGFSSYQAYLNSELWNGIHNAVMDRDSRTCGICRQTANHVHHSVLQPGGSPRRRPVQACCLLPQMPSTPSEVRSATQVVRSPASAKG
jgi:hypothetical protein